VRTGRRDWLWGLAFLVVLAGVVIIAIMLLTGGSSANEPPISGIECERERQEYHVHPRLRIYIEGQQVAIPANIGIKEGECFYWLHTHADADQGVIHVEAPEQAVYTLGQFFAIWGQPLSSTQLLDRTTDATHSIRATVNGTPLEGDPAQIELVDNAQIVLEFGPPFAEG
jgi:hypothetical protein